MVLAVVNIILNYIFITSYDIIGAAIATLIAILIVNVSKCIFIYVKFNLHPFSIGTLKTLSIGLICFTALYLIPVLNISIIDIIVKGGFLSIVYFTSLIYFNVSTEITEAYRKIKVRLFKMII